MDINIIKQRIAEQDLSFWLELKEKSVEYAINEPESAKCSFGKLVTKVAKIDLEAAMYLREEAPNMVSFQYSGCLEDVMHWIDTPQGHDFWKAIHIQVLRGILINIKYYKYKGL